MTTDLLSQLNALIADAEANQVDAELWRETRRLMMEAGYGPRILPAQIFDLVPNVHLMNEFVAATQEVVPASTTGTKMPRRKLTLEDERVITARAASGCPAAQIAEDLGIAPKVVRNLLDRTHA